MNPRQMAFVCFGIHQLIGGKTVGRDRDRFLACTVVLLDPHLNSNDADQYVTKGLARRQRASNIEVALKSGADAPANLPTRARWTPR